jgi:hypothetical protein
VVSELHHNPIREIQSLGKSTYLFIWLSTESADDSPDDKPVAMLEHCGSNMSRGRERETRRGAPLRRSENPELHELRYDYPNEEELSTDIKGSY